MIRPINHFKLSIFENTSSCGLLDVLVDPDCCLFFCGPTQPQVVIDVGDSDPYTALLRPEFDSQAFYDLLIMLGSPFGVRRALWLR